MNLLHSDAGDTVDPIHSGRTHVPETDDTVDLIHPGRTHVADVREDMVSELCPVLESEPVPRTGLHLQNEAAQLAAEVAELDHAQVSNDT